MAKILKWATGEDGKRYCVDNFKSKAEAQKQKYTDNKGNTVVPVLCTDKSRHFRRENGTHGGYSNGSNMSDIHNKAQERFIAFFRSRYSLFVTYFDSSYKRVRFDLKKYYDTCKKEAAIEGLRADVLLTSNEHPEYPPILIEVKYTHACDDVKIRKNLLIIEFKVEDLKEIDYRLRNLHEDDTRDIDPDVRFHNFRERESELPWQENL